MTAYEPVWWQLILRDIIDEVPDGGTVRLVHYPDQEDNTDLRWCELDGYRVTSVEVDFSPEAVAAAQREDPDAIGQAVVTVEVMDDAI